MIFTRNVTYQSNFRNENEKYYNWANHTAIFCQPDVTRQCERKLASSSSTEISGVVSMISWLKANEHGHVNR